MVQKSGEHQLISRVRIPLFTTGFMHFMWHFLAKFHHQQYHPYITIMTPQILKPKVSKVHVMNSLRFGLVVKGAPFFEAL